MDYIYEFSEPAQVERTISTDQLGIGVFMIEATQKIKGIPEPSTEVVFSLGVGGSVVGDPVIDEDRIYFGACDKNFYCVDFNGKEIWRFPTGGVIWHCALENGVIYFGCHDGNLYALSTEGKLVWKFSARDKIAGRPVVYKNVVYFACRDGNLYAVSTEGKLLWKYYEGSPIYSSFTIENDTVYLGSSSGNFIALDTTGKVKWVFKAKMNCGGSLVVGNKVLFVSWDQHLYCLDKQGKLIWSFKANNKISLKNPTVESESIYFGSYDNNLYCVSLDGKLKWKFPTGNIVFPSPIVEGERLFFGSTDGTFYCLNKESGKKVWEYKDAGITISNAAMKGKMIVFSCFDCKLVALDTDGHLLWNFPTSLSYISPVRIDSASPQHQATQMILPAEIMNQEKNHYQVQSLDSVGESMYTAKNTYTMKSVYQGKWKIRTMSSGWDE